MSDRIEVMMKSKNCGGGHNLKRLLAPLFIAILLFSIAPTASAGWDYYRAIEINNGTVSGNLSSFPVLINHTADWLKYENTSGKVRESHGYDIVFTNADSSSLLAYEIEEYNGTAGTLVAWVRIPTLNHSAPNTTIRLWYGNPAATDWSNPTGVWDSNYKMVQHLNETSGTQYDSTANDNDGTPYGGLNENATGKIDGADDFDGDDYIFIPNSDSLNITGDTLTLEAWIKWGIDPETGDPWANIINKAADNEWQLQHNQSNTRFEFAVNTIDGRTFVQSATHSQQGVWYHVVGVYNGHKPHIYVDGKHDGEGWSRDANISVSSSDVNIGRRTYNDRYFNGTIDEVRISSTARSGDWINTSHNNQNSPSTFYEVKGATSTEGSDPVPELPTVILFAVGLVVLTGYVWLRGKNK